MENNEQIDFTKCTYLSYPMQTGKALYLKMKKENKSNITDFCAQNSQKAKWIKEYNHKKSFDFVQKSIENFDKIINPGKMVFVLTGKWGGKWESESFLKTDLYLIDKYAEQIVFFEDWYYSLGCVEEFKLASDKNIKMYECFQNHSSNRYYWDIYIELTPKYIKSCFEKAIEFFKMCGIQKINSAKAKAKEDEESICEQFRNYILIYTK